MICVQYGPITIAVRSITRTPASGPALVRLAMKYASVAATVCEVEAVADVLGMTVGHHHHQHCTIDIPATAPHGHWKLVVIANGIASEHVSVEIV